MYCRWHPRCYKNSCITAGIRHATGTHVLPLASATLRALMYITVGMHHATGTHALPLASAMLVHHATALMPYRWHTLCYRLSRITVGIRHIPSTHVLPLASAMLQAIMYYSWHPRCYRHSCITVGNCLADASICHATGTHVLPLVSTQAFTYDRWQMQRLFMDYYRRHPPCYRHSCITVYICHATRTHRYYRWLPSRTGLQVLPLAAAMLQTLRYDCRHAQNR